MGLADPEGVEKTHCVVGHIVQGVGWTALLPSRERPEIRHPCLIEFRGETRIPVIEPDDVMTPL